jgi:hypothetical protein
MAPSKPNANLLSGARLHFYQNYFMPNRLDEYRAVLQSIITSEYEFRTMFEFAGAIKSGVPQTSPVCVWRIDVDSDPRAAGRMFAVERELGIRTTYYFRLETMDVPLIRDIAAHGSEVGYHFEEVATVAKRLGLRNESELSAHRTEIRDEFARNLIRFRDVTGVFPKTIASHGDFLNRKLGISSYWLLDQELMDEFEIFAAVSDHWLMPRLRNYVIDRPPPARWYPRSLENAMKDRPAILPVIVHPRQWVPNPWLYTRLDLARVSEEIAYRLRTRGRRN